MIMPYLICYDNLCNLNWMSQLNFKAILARIKEDFHARFIILKRNHLTIEQTAQLLYKYMNGQPTAIKETLMRSTGKNELVWDDLLLFLQEELSIIQAVKKIEYSPLSATEIIDKHTSEFGKLINYVKMKETNTMQSLHQVPAQIVGENIIAVCFDKEILFYDCHHSTIINTLQFRYTHVRGKLLEKEEQRKIQKLQQSEKVNIEMSDQVQEIINISNNKGNSQRPVHFLTSNIKNSVWGSELSSEKSNEKMMFRKANTESIERRRMKSTVTKIKNDDVQKVFQFFEQSSLENSINIAHAFVRARQNFQKSIVLENSFLDKEVKQRNFDLSSAKFHKNYHRELVEMKKTNKQLSGVRANLSLSVKSRHEQSTFYPRKDSVYERDSLYFKTKKEEVIDPLEMNNKQLEIINLCFFENYLLVTLFNREIRLFKLKRALNRISEQLIFQKCFREVITFGQLYRSQNTDLYHVVVGFEKDNQSQIAVYHLDDQMKLKEKVFEHEFAYSAKFQSIMPFGVALYNELGYFSIVELNSCLAGNEERLATSTQLFNPETNYRISINQVRINKKLSNIFISCTSGYVYLYDRYIKSIKYQTKICQSPILDICLFHSDQELLILYGNGNMAILSTFHLQKIYLYQSYGQISQQSKIFKGQLHNFYIYTSRAIMPYCLCQNQEKRFNNIKSAKILKSRMKLKNKERKAVEKARVLKVVQGKGGDQDFLGVVLEKGEILIFNHRLEYVGSYFYFKVGHITELYSNKCHQFIAILLDNNTIEVVNLYTQKEIFTVKVVDNDGIVKNNVRSDSSLYSSAMGNKVRPKKASTGVNFVHFMDVEISNCFLSVISKTGKVSHYSEKGTLLNCINLQDRLGDSVQGSMVYDDEELVIASDGNLIILYRKSYNRKGVIKVSHAPIAKIRKCQSNRYSICALDCSSSIFLVNTYGKEVNCILHGAGAVSKYQHLLFNEFFLFKISEEKGTVFRFKQKDELSFAADHEKYFFSIIGVNLMQINRFSGKMSRYNFSLDGFEEFVF